MSTEPLQAKLKEPFDKHDGIAQKNQRWRLTFALFAAALGPIAVYLLSVQALAYPEGGSTGKLLIGGELLALFIALAMGFMHLTRSHATWIRERLRAEILRREMFLLEMRVGPYLTEAHCKNEDIVDQRLLQINAEEREPEECLVAADDKNGNWRDSLEDQRLAGQSTPIPSLLNSISNYLETRVRHQRDWFNKKCKYHGSLARWWENGAKLVLLLAFLVAALHLGMLLAPGHADPSLHRSLIITAICLPPLGAALVALLSILGSHRLTRSYWFSATVLNEIEGKLQLLKSNIDPATGATDVQIFNLKRLVLQTEELLSQDLLRWWLIMKPEAPRAGP